MAKKGTVGGPRTRRTTSEDVERRKKYKSRAERDKMWQRRVLFATILLIGVSLAVLVGAIFYEQVWRPHQAVTTVNGVEVSTKDFQERVRLSRWLTAEKVRSYFYLFQGNTDYLQQYVGQDINNLRYPSLMGSQVLSEMEEDIILQQSAKELGVTVDNAAVDREVNDYMASQVGLISPDSPTATPTVEPTVSPTITPTPENLSSPTPGPSPTPSLTPTPTLSPTPTATLEPDMIRATLSKEDSTFTKTAMDKANVSKSAIRDLFYYQTLRITIQDAIGKDVPTEELQVDARHILIAFNPNVPSGQTAPPPTEEEKTAAKAKADEVLTALQNGEPFADLAKAVSNDSGSAAQGGELGWSSPDSFVPEFKDAVLNAEIGQIIGPIETQYGYHIIQVHAREVRALSASDLQTRRSDAYQKWLDDKKAAANIKRRSDWPDRVPNDPTYNNLLGDILPISQ
jgi:parvulin-like peptidyl-prolyl isomerase